MNSNYLFDTDLYEYYTDKKYINTNEFIVENLEQHILKDITNIVIQYLDEIPICSLCNGKSNKNVIIHYYDIEYYPHYYNDEEENNGYDSYSEIENEINICITCLLLKIPYTLRKPIIYNEELLCICNKIINTKNLYKHYTKYNHIDYIEKYELFRKYYDSDNEKYLKIFKFIQNTVEFGVIDISNRDIKYLYTLLDDVLNKYLNELHESNFDIVDYPHYNFPFFPLILT